MATNRADKQRKRSAKPRGRPFTTGNPWSWKPGESGNPSGRTSKVKIAEAYSTILGLPIPDDPMERTYAEGIAQKVAELALRGSTFAIVEMTDRTEGKPTETHKNEHNFPNGMPVYFQNMLKAHGNDDAGSTGNSNPTA